MMLYGTLKQCIVLEEQNAFESRDHKLRLHVAKDVLKHYQTVNSTCMCPIVHNSCIPAAHENCHMAMYATACDPQRTNPQNATVVHVCGEVR